MNNTPKILIFALGTLLVVSFSCSSKKDETFKDYFLANQWRADYGREGAPVIDSTNYRTYVSAIKEDGVMSGVGDVGQINATRDTIHFRATPSAWVLIKKTPQE